MLLVLLVPEVLDEEAMRSKAQGTATCFPPAAEDCELPVVLEPGVVAPPLLVPELEVLLLVSVLLVPLELVPPGVVALPVLLAPP